MECEDHANQEHKVNSKLFSESTPMVNCVDNRSHKGNSVHADTHITFRVRKKMYHTLPGLANSLREMPTLENVKTIQAKTTGAANDS